MSASANEDNETSTTVNIPSWHGDANWTYIQNDLITIMFPAGGTKPMFLWWYTKDPNNINVVKFKGLIEYTTFDVPYFVSRNQANASNIEEQMRMHYYEPAQSMMHDMVRRAIIEDQLGELRNAGHTLGLHAPYLPFSGSKWVMSQPANVTNGDVKYLSFNFTLTDVPSGRPNFQFAEGNIILRFRFYYTPATENVYGKYTYDVAAGEFKIDIVIKNWQWNVDKLAPIIQRLRAAGLNIPQAKASLALWVNLASINATKIAVAENDAKGTEDSSLTEQVSMTQQMYVEGSKVSVVQNNSGMMDETPMQNAVRERFTFRFQTTNATTFAGFFKFVPQAIVTDGHSYNVTDVTASYISAGSHIRLFIGYPYFGNNTLEHDPSFGIESITPWLPTNLLLVLIGGTIAIAAAVAAIRMRRRPVNIVRVQ